MAEEKKYASPSVYTNIPQATVVRITQPTPTIGFGTKYSGEATYSGYTTPSIYSPPYQATITVSGSGGIISEKTQVLPQAEQQKLEQFEAQRQAAEGPISQATQREFDIELRRVQAVTASRTLEERITQPKFGEVRPEYRGRPEGLIREFPERFAAGGVYSIVNLPSGLKETGKTLLKGGPIAVAKGQAESISLGIRTDPGFTLGAVITPGLVLKGIGTGLGKVSKAKPIKTIGTTKTEIIEKGEAFGIPTTKAKGVGYFASETGKFKVATKAEFESFGQFSPKAVSIETKIIPTEAQVLAKGTFETAIEKPRFFGLAGKTQETIKGKFTEVGFAGKETKGIIPEIRIGATAVKGKTITTKGLAFSREIFKQGDVSVFRTVGKLKGERVEKFVSKDIIKDMTKDFPEGRIIFPEETMRFARIEHGKPLMSPKSLGKMVKTQQVGILKDIGKQQKISIKTASRITGRAPVLKIGMKPLQREMVATKPRTEMKPISKTATLLKPILREDVINVQMEKPISLQTQAFSISPMLKTAQTGAIAEFITPKEMIQTPKISLLPSLPERTIGLKRKEGKRKKTTRLIRYSPSIVGMFEKGFKMPKISLGIEVRPSKRRRR